MIANIIIGLLGLTSGFFFGAFTIAYAVNYSAKKYKEETGNDFMVFVRKLDEQQKQG